MKRIKLYILVNLTILTGLFSVLNAQWSANFGSYITVDRNLYRNYSEIGDTYETLYLDFIRDISAKESNLRMYLSLQKAIYNEYSARNENQQLAGVVYTRQYGDNGLIFNLGGNYRITDYKDVYDILDNRTAKIYSNIISRGVNRVLSGGYYGEIISYKGLSSQDRFDNNFFLKWQRFFPSRTGIHVNLLFGYNHYLNNENLLVESVEMSESSNSATRVESELKVSQAINDRTGINVTAQLSSPVASSRRLVLIRSDYIFSEEELFDLPYDYGSGAVYFQLSHLLTENLSLKLNTGTQQRNYVDQPAYDLAGELLPSGDLRKDTRHSVALDVSKKIYFSEKSDRHITAYVSMLWLRNDSNDEYYSYTNHITNISLAFSF